MKVSFCIFTYNQENYIEETITSVLKQSYSPLEIIISDDNSTDATFIKINNITQAYTGPNSIKINRNIKNLGIGAHVSKVLYTMTSGELMIILGGDDFVDKDFVKFAVKQMTVNNDINLIDFNGVVIDQNGDYIRKIELNSYKEKYTLDDYLHLKTINSFAPGRIIRRELIENFKPIEDNCPTEDAILVFRGLLTTGILRINNPLVFYRRHQTSITGTQGLLNFSNNAIVSQHIKDALYHFKSGHLTEKEIDLLLLRLKYELKKRNLIFSYSKNIIQKILKKIHVILYKSVYLFKLNLKLNNEL